MPFLNTDDIEPKEPLPGWQGRFFNSETMTFGYYNTQKGAVLHEHAHPNEETWHVIAGELEITVEGETKLVSAGGVAIVPPNALHAVRVISEGRVIVVDHPKREAFGAVKSVS